MAVQTNSKRSPNGARRANGEGSIYPVKGSKKWQVAVYQMNTKSEWKRVRRTFATKREAETFLSLVKNTFAAMGIPEDISFIDTPEDIRDKYQYFTEANMHKLLSIGYNKPFHSLEQGVGEYVKEYLAEDKYL